MKQNDNEKQFISFIEEYKRLICKICYMYATDGDNFKDLYQEVVINLWRGFDTYEGRGKLSSWIYRVGLNTCISFYRQQQRRGEHTSLDALYGLEAENDETTIRLKEMYRLIAGLNKFERAIILLWLDENSYEEIAEIVGVPRNTVASRLKRIKDKLTKQANS
ncbi:RNA polymerase sigma factor [Bacteroides sp. UBA939]|uniref:RNA polymerase sigma factor n=1 Tax=Bacteroides sp. UBA939 TaxID=1946092 RepID=UPI0025BF6AAF|nr:sigma-70 family RNA polymerase sigma factor [Bacteroides sp. UBA939]